MKNLSLILRIVTAMIITTRRFKMEECIYPQLLFKCLVETFSNTEGNTSTLSLYWDKHSGEWSSLVKSDQAAVHIQPDNHIVFITSVRVNEIWHSLEWDSEQFTELDSMIINTILNYISKHIIDLPEKEKIEERLCLTDNPKKQFKIIQNPENSTTITIKTFTDGIEVQIKKDKEPAENAIIPWNQIVKWLELRILIEMLEV